MLVKVASAIKTRIVLGQTEMHFPEFTRKKFLLTATDAYEEAREVLVKNRKSEYHKYFAYPIAEALLNLQRQRAVRPFTLFEEPSNPKILQGKCRCNQARIFSHDQYNFVQTMTWHQIAVGFDVANISGVSGKQFVVYERRESECEEDSPWRICYVS